MSEYIELNADLSGDPLVGVIETNLTLATDGDEVYASAEALLEGSPVAHALANIPGIVRLVIERHALVITRDPDVEWYVIVEDVSAALKDFFL